jgi:hypothetical protein
LLDTRAPSKTEGSFARCVLDGKGRLSGFWELLSSFTAWLTKDVRLIRCSCHFGIARKCCANKKSRSHDVLVFSVDTCLKMSESFIAVTTLDPLGIRFSILIPTLPWLREESSLEDDDDVSSPEETCGVTGKSGQDHES